MLSPARRFLELHLAVKSRLCRQSIFRPSMKFCAHAIFVAIRARISNCRNFSNFVKRRNFKNPKFFCRGEYEFLGNVLKKYCKSVIFGQPVLVYSLGLQKVSRIILQSLPTGKPKPSGFADMYFLRVREFRPPRSNGSKRRGVAAYDDCRLRGDGCCVAVGGVAAPEPGF